MYVHRCVYIHRCMKNATNTCKLYRLLCVKKTQRSVSPLTQLVDCLASHSNSGGGGAVQVSSCN